MKKNMFIISDNEEIDSYWLKHKLEIFIENKILNEDYGNFYVINEDTPFCSLCLEFLKNLDEKNRRILVTNTNDFWLKNMCENYINERKILNDYFSFIKDMADFIIFYSKNENEYIKFAIKNKIPYINFY